MKTNLFFLFVLCIFNSYNQAELTGNIKSGTTPIPYVKIYTTSNTSAVLSDKDGSFKIKCAINDTLIVESNQFELDTFIVKNYNPVSINLVRKNYKTLEVAVVKRYKFNKIIAPKKTSKISSSQILPYFEECVFVPNYENEKGIINSISVYIPNGSNPNAPFRINLYTVDLLTNTPKTSFLNEEIILYPTKTTGWFTIRFDTLKLVLPKYGFYVAVEALPFPELKVDKDNPYQIINPEQSILAEPLALGTTTNQKDKKSFHYFKVNNDMYKKSGSTDKWQAISNRQPQLSITTELTIFSSTPPSDGTLANSKNESELDTTRITFKDLKNLKEIFISTKDLKKIFNSSLNVDRVNYSQTTIKNTLISSIKSLKSEDEWNYFFIYLMSYSLQKNEKDKLLKELYETVVLDKNPLEDREKLITLFESVLTTLNEENINPLSKTDIFIKTADGLVLQFKLRNNQWYIHNLFVIPE